MKSIRKYFPILEWLPQYKKHQLQGDLFAGITVGVMLIPQGMAYALIAGLPPVYGLYASLVPQLIYAMLGTSRQLSVAPVAMDSLLVASGVAVLATEGTEAYIHFAILLAFFMGAFQLLLGGVRLGFITNLLSRPVISGFTSAAALIIGLSQLKYLLGVDIIKSNRVYEIVANTVDKLGEVNIAPLLIGLLGIIIILLTKRISKKIPGALIVVILGTIASYGLNLHAFGVSIVKEIPGGLPAFIIPDFKLGSFGELIPLALTIAVVAFMEAYSVSKALEAKKRDHKVMPNQELIALGVSNLVGSFFQSFPVTGGFSRSAVNHQVGANTLLSSVFSVLLIGLTLLFLTPLFYHLPHAVLASIIMVAVIGLVDRKYARYLYQTDKVEFLLFIVTFLITLNLGMINGIVSGIVFSILILLYKAAYPHVAILGKVENSKEFRNIERFDNLQQWDNLLIMRVDTPYAFINIQTIKDRVLKEAELRKEKLTHIILDASSVSHVDATAIQEINALTLTLKEMGIQLVFTSVIGPVRDAFHKNWSREGTQGQMFLNTNVAVKALTGQEVELLNEHVVQVNV
ncbi:MAG: sulfate permease [Roseivirga sp.]|nr:sulfate permease [Roseivirga sp.]